MEPLGKLRPLPIKGKPTAPQDSIHIVPRKFGSFTLKANGVFHYIKKGKHDDVKEEFICSPLEVIARSHDEGGKSGAMCCVGKTRTAVFIPGQRHLN